MELKDLNVGDYVTRSSWDDWFEVMSISENHFQLRSNLDNYRHKYQLSNLYDYTKKPSKEIPMKKTRSVKVKLIQQISGLYKQVSYFDLGTGLPVNLEATLFFDVPEQKILISKYKLREVLLEYGCIPDGIIEELGFS